MESLNVAIQISFKDFLNFQLIHLRKRMLPFLIILALMLISSLYSFFFLDSATITEWMSPMIIFLIFPSAFFCLIYFNAKKSFNSDSFIRKEHVYNFSKEKLRVTTENSDLNLDWKDIYRYFNTKHNFIVYLSPQKALIIPKRFLQDAEQNFVLSLFQSEIKPKKDRSSFIRIGIYAIIIIVVALSYSSIFTTSATEYFNKGYDAENEGKYKEAIEEFNKALDKNPKMVQIYLHRGYSKSQLGDTLGYLNDCNKAIEINNNFAEAYRYRAYIKYQLGDSTGMCQDFQKAKSLGDKEAIKDLEQYCN